MEVVVTGFAGLEGSLAVYREPDRKKELLGRYTGSFFAIFENGESVSEKYFSGELGVLFAAQEALGRARKAGDRGVLGALWDLLHGLKLGAEFSQRSIPVLQQTIELCEFFELDPYRLPADCCVWAADEAGSILKAAKAADVPAAVIGFTAKGPGILRTDGESDSYLRKN